MTLYVVAPSMMSSTRALHHWFPLLATLATQFYNAEVYTTDFDTPFS